MVKIYNNNLRENITKFSKQWEGKLDYFVIVIDKERDSQKPEKLDREHPE